MSKTITIVKRLLVIIPVLFVLSCSSKKQNELVSTVLIFDEPVSGYNVSGTFYPFDAFSETGQVELTFAPVSGGKALVYSDADLKFTDKSIYDYVFSEGFSGFHDGDTLICHYDDAKHPDFDSPLNYDAGFQFFDVDFDGEDEFLINDFYRGKCGNHYSVYEITSDGFVLNNEYPFNYLTNETEFHPWTKEIRVRVNEDKFESVNLLLNAKPFDDAAEASQCKILNTLKADALDAYKKERESFSAWYEYQQIISEEVIGDMWELAAGGSAGWSFQEKHLYDIAKKNASEQAALYDALIKKPSSSLATGVDIMEQIDSEKEKLVKDYSSFYSQFENIGPDGWPNVKNTPAQISEYLDTDLDLFKQWMADREVLASCLKKNLRTYYDSLTEDWKAFFLQEFKEHYVFNS